MTSTRPFIVWDEFTTRLHWWLTEHGRFPTRAEIIALRGHATPRPHERTAA